MSDASHELGWWIASDGKWYPPELHPDAKKEDFQARVELHLVEPQDDGEYAPAAGWWIASDGKWYPPELHPDAKFSDDASWGDDEEGHEDLGALAELWHTEVDASRLADVIPLAIPDSSIELPENYPAFRVVVAPVAAEPVVFEAAGLESPDEIAGNEAAELESVEETAVLRATVRDGAVLDGAVLDGAVLEGTVREGTVLDGTVLEGTMVEAPVAELTMTEVVLAASADELEVPGAVGDESGAETEAVFYAADPVPAPLEPAQVAVDFFGAPPQDAEWANARSAPSGLIFSADAGTIEEVPGGPFGVQPVFAPPSQSPELRVGFRRFMPAQGSRSLTWANDAAHDAKADEGRRSRFRR